MKKTRENLYGWIILILFLIPSCFFISKGINSFLFFMAKTPLYTNISRYDDLDMTVGLPENWGFSDSESGFLLVNDAYSESITITEVKSAKNMNVAKDMMLLSLKDSYDTELDLKEGTISGETNIFYVTYNIYSTYYVSGVVENNGIYANFVYKTSLTNKNVSPITDIIKSIRFSKVNTPNIEIEEDASTDSNRTKRGGF